MSFEQAMLAPLCNRARRDAKLLSDLVSPQHARFPKPTETAFEPIALTDVDHRDPREAVTFS
jgi:hypothetical protein